MRTRTHAVVSSALSLAILRPNNIEELVLTVAVSAIGGTICDIDATTKETKKKTTIGIIGFVLLLLIGYYIDYKNSYNIFNLFINNNPYISIIGLILILIICFYGMDKPHRSFLHSILCFILLTSITYICFNNIYLPFIIGFISHILLDILNKREVKLLYPSNRGISLKKCSYNGKEDIIIFITSTIITIILIIMLLLI